MDDLISRQAALNCFSDWYDKNGDVHSPDDMIEFQRIEALPSAEPGRKNGMWTTEQVAEILANLFGDECACNCNGIDEWLPSACKYVDTQCPDPKEKHGCWMQFLIQGGGGTGE